MQEKTRFMSWNRLRKNPVRKRPVTRALSFNPGAGTVLAACAQQYASNFVAA